MQMHTTQAEKLVRKQFLISPSQVKKLSRLARDEETSVAEMVRVAIDSYNPDALTIADLDAPELMALVSKRLKEAISSTKKANRTIGKTLKKLSKGEL
jgi:predicted secreted protein